MTVEREKEGRAEFTLFARWECKYRTYGSIYFLGKLYYSLVPLPHARSKEKTFFVAAFDHGAKIDARTTHIYTLNNFFTSMDLINFILNHLIGGSITHSRSINVEII